MNRQTRQRLAHSTVEIVSTGRLGDFDISDYLQASKDGTCSYSEHDRLPPLLPKLPLPSPKRQQVYHHHHHHPTRTTRIDVINTTTLDAAWQLRQHHPTTRVAALNFASAKYPGGSFLKGSKAQEESLALNSSLYYSIKDDPMYSYHRRTDSAKPGIYSDWVIYTPNVLVFRDENDGSVLEEPWWYDVISSPCVNLGQVQKKQHPHWSRMSPLQLEHLLLQRIRRMLTVLAVHHSGNVVLGAWGCGVFQNDPTTIARLFAKCLFDDERFVNRWPRIVFAVLDRPNGETFRAFDRVFGEDGHGRTAAAAAGTTTTKKTNTATKAAKRRSHTHPNSMYDTHGTATHHHAR